MLAILRSLDFGADKDSVRLLSLLALGAVLLAMIWLAVSARSFHIDSKAEFVEQQERLVWVEVKAAEIAAQRTGANKPTPV